MCNLHMRHTPDFRSMGVLLGVVVHAYNQTTAGAVAVAVAVAVAAAITIAFDITLVRWWFHGGSRRQGEVLNENYYSVRVTKFGNNGTIKAANWPPILPTKRFIRGFPAETAA
ncbi:hypothetical protein GQX74_005175 [Glossina fuscipes]|nr:hypothetical protein GQX74_005175 [Glossina fuscipes]